MIWQKIHYIHGNPVKARLVTSTKDYPWSSFRAFYYDSQEPLPIDKDWWWPDDSEKLSRAVKELGWRTYHKRDKRDAKKSGGKPPFPTCEVEYIVQSLVSGGRR